MRVRKGGGGHITYQGEVVGGGEMVGKDTVVSR